MDTSATTDITYEKMAQSIDHSLLRPELTRAEVSEGCELAARYEVASVCVKPADVVLAADLLRDSPVAVGTVIGFPHGSHTPATKVFESEQALAEGATELDMVINIGRLRASEDAWVGDDIAGVVAAASEHAIVKVILENAYLTDDEKVRGCRLAEAAGGGGGRPLRQASTGFAPGGATLEDLRLMRATVSPHVKVKAAGGVRSLDALIEVLSLGVDRVGATQTEAILDEFKGRRGRDR